MVAGNSHRVSDSGLEVGMCDFDCATPCEMCREDALTELAPEAYAVEDF